MKVCVVKNCNSGEGTKSGRSFFQFPVDTDKSNIWKVNTRCKHPTRRSFVCDLHFDKKFIHYTNNSHRRRLLKTAVPTRVSEPIHSDAAPNLPDHSYSSTDHSYTSSPTDHNYLPLPPDHLYATRSGSNIYH